MKNIKYGHIDLFAGCGGLSLGLELAGFTPLFVNEINPDALSSYLINRQDHYPWLKEKEFHCYDVKELVNKKRIAKLKKNILDKFHIDINKGDLPLIVGGPPCQGFSGIGHRRSYSVEKEKLPSNHLYQDMAWIINELKPKIFLFENVKGLLNAKWNKDGKNGEVWNDVLATFKNILDYTVEFSLVHAKNYGVSQNRPRVLLVGIRNDINKKIPKNSSIANGYLPSPTFNAPDLSELLGDILDPAYSNGSSTKKYPKQAKTDIQKWYRTMRDGNIAQKNAPVTEHDYSKHSDNVLNKFNHMISNNGEISSIHKTKKFSQKLLPAKWNDKGPTITATSLPDDYVHYSQPRILTVREWARLQSFPDWYQFAGSRTTGGIRRAGNPRAGIFERELPKYTQIGNAVPVKLGESIGYHFIKILKNVK